MTTIIGIDPSSKKVAATITVDEKQLFMDVCQLPEAIEDACHQAFIYTQNLVTRYGGKNEVVVFVEEPVLGRGGAWTTIRQSQIRGCIIGGARSMGSAVYGVNNQRWKKEVLGAGNIRKDQIPIYVKELWPNAFEMAGKDGDLIDSACINRYGSHVLNLRERIVQRKFKRRRIKRTR